MVNYNQQLEAEALLESNFFQISRELGIAKATTQLLDTINSQPDTISIGFQYKFLQQVYVRWPQNQPDEIHDRLMERLITVCQQMGDWQRVVELIRQRNTLLPAWSLYEIFGKRRNETHDVILPQSWHSKK